MIKKYQIKSITIVSDLPFKKFIFFRDVAIKAKIPSIMIPSGLNVLALSEPDTPSAPSPDYYLSPNLFYNYYKKKKNRLLGSPRYSPTWIENLKYIYNFDKKKPLL